MRIAIVKRPIDPQALVAEVARTANGATILFLGTVRDVNDGRAVSGIEYASYESMAARELDAIAREASARFGTFKIRHRKTRMARNPRTGSPVEVSARPVPVFKPSKELRAMVAGVEDFAEERTEASEREV